jgi:capsular polysaccharide biosynthesis protein
MFHRLIETIIPSGTPLDVPTSDSDGALVFVSRRDSPGRCMENEDDLYSGLEPYGFKKVVLSSLAYEQQIELFANASMIVAQHGAGLTNIGFARHGTKIVEIFGEHYINPCFARLARILNHQYFPIINRIPEEDSQEISRFAARRLTLKCNIAHTLEIIRGLL